MQKINTEQFGKSQTGERIPPAFTSKIAVNNGVITSPDDIANAFNNYFIDVTTSVPIITSNCIPNRLSSLFVKPTNDQEVLNIIKRLRDTSSVGYDSFTTKIVKLCASVFAKVLAHLINVSFIDGLFPFSPLLNLCL